VLVTDAALADGLLSISLKRELPEALKPRRIEIAVGQAASLIEGEKAA
jgi:molecular chaperone IbpA